MKGARSPSSLMGKLRLSELSVSTSKRRKGREAKRVMARDCARGTGKIDEE
jgi:hypothetical protein